MGTVNLNYVKEKSVEAISSITSHSHFLDIPLEVQSFENAYILPRIMCNACVATSEGKGVWGSQLSEEYRAGYTFDKNNVKYIDEEVIYMGYHSPIFGHCLTDGIKRFWFLGTDFFKQLKSNGVKCVYILPNCDINQQLPIIHELLKLFGEDFDQWERVSEETKYKKIYVPNCSLIYKDGERYWTKEFKETVSNIRSNAVNCGCTPKKEDKVYLSRIRFADAGREMGEKDVEECFMKWGGYSVIHPEQYTIFDQIRILHDVRNLVTTEGSIAHSAMFCLQGAKVTILRKADYVNTYQVAIDEMADLDVTYIDIHKTHNKYENLWPWNGPFFLYKSPQLLAYFNKHQFVWPVLLRPTYWWYLLRQTKVMQRYISNRRLTKKIERFLFS